MNINQKKQILNFNSELSRHKNMPLTLPKFPSSFYERKEKGRRGKGREKQREKERGKGRRRKEKRKGMRSMQGGEG